MEATAAGSAVEFFPALQTLGVVRHGFVRRIRGIDVATDRVAALARLEQVHRAIRTELGLGTMAFATAEQVHGGAVAVVDQPLAADRCFGEVDGLITNQRDISLGIYVADCCAIFIADPIARVVGLVHSGRKGTEFAIAAKAVEKMRDHFGSQPNDIVAQLSPCIRPPHYEVDFAAEIVRQLRAAGVRQVQETNRCTACDLDSYYSYRAEKARTGRMLALLALQGCD
jgi:hypothetical protein